MVRVWESVELAQCDGVLGLMKVLASVRGQVAQVNQIVERTD